MLAALGLVGCSTLAGGSSERVAQPEAQSRDVADARTLELQRQAARAEAEIRLLRRHLAALQVEVERLAAAAEREGASSGGAVAFPPPTGVVSPGRFESTELEPMQVTPRSEVIEPEVTAAPPAPEVIEPEVTAVPPPLATGTVERETAPVPLAAQAIYDRGYTLYHQGRYVDAESSFQRFLQAHADTGLADNARFWIGESRFARGDFMSALLAYQEVLDHHPTGNKVADALLKSGDCLLELDNAEGARQRYEEVARRFPGSAAAVMAEERLGRSRD
jgi:tol-pal system protein YbgF